MKSILLLSLALLPSFALAQEPSKSEATLPVPTEWKATDVPTNPIFGNIVCGDDSSLYLRTAAGKENPFEGKIVEVSANGVTRSIDPKEGIGFEGRTIFSAFNVDHDGALYAVVNPAQDYKSSYIVAYDKERHMIWKAALHQPIHATFILPMANEHFLISGFLPQSKAGVPPFTVTSVFDKGGNELKSVKLTEDDASITKDPLTGNIFNNAVQLANARLDKGGNAYVFKGTSPPTVQIVDPEGNVLKTFRPPPPEASLQAFDFLLLKDSFAISFQEPDDPDGKVLPRVPTVVVYDSKSGQKLASYKGPETMSPSCSHNNTLTYFTSTPDHKFYQVGTAKLR